MIRLSGAAGRDVGCVRRGVNSPPPWAPSGRRRWASWRGVCREQPPSFNNSPAVPGLAEEEASPRAGGEETESEGAARWGDDGRPPRLPRGTECAASPGTTRGNKNLRLQLARCGVERVSRGCWGPVLRIHYPRF